MIPRCVQGYRLYIACMVVLLAVVLTACGTTVHPAVQAPVSQIPAESAQARKHRLAAYWAPLIYHDTADDCYQCDYLTKFNFDGDYDGSNNWDNLGGKNTVPAYVYYAVSETRSHLFISYFFFHPRDWGTDETSIGEISTQHENDLEGILIVVKGMESSSSGELVGVETQAHNEQYQFSYCPDRNNDGSLDPVISSGGETVDGCISVFADDTGIHPMIGIESQGHGVGACCLGGKCIANAPRIQCDSARGGDGIIYYFGDRADSPDYGDGNYTRRYSYQLIAMNAGAGTPGQDSSEDQGFWYLRNYIGENRTFHSWGVFRGDDDDGPDMDCGEGMPDCDENAAKAPWAWDDGDDHQVYVGDIFCDPAFAFDTHVDGDTDKDYSLYYVDHDYYTHKFSMPRVYLREGDCDLGDGDNDCDVYFNVDATGSPGNTRFIGEDNWKKNNMEIGKWVARINGGDDATGPRSYGEDTSARYICRAGGTSTVFTIEAFDSDSGSSDDHIDNPYKPPVPSYSMNVPGTNMGKINILFSISVNE